jgi:hypothetical protein
MTNEEMFMNFYGSDKNSQIYGAIASLIFTHRDQFYNALYEAICNYPSYVILSDLELSKKIKVIEGMLEYYEVRESYERCAKLLTIKKEIEEYVKN